MKIFNTLLFLSIAIVSWSQDSTSIVTVKAQFNDIYYKFDTLNHILYVEGEGVDFGNGELGRYYCDETGKHRYVRNVDEPWRYWWGEMEKIVVGEGITEIHNYSSLSLKTVVLPTSLKVIGKQAFAYSLLLKRVDFPSKMTAIRDRAFYACLDLEEVHFPKELDSIGTNAFCGIPAKEIILPNNLTFLVKEAFSFPENGGANVIYMPDSLRIIPSGVFLYSTEIEELHIPSTVQKIDPFAFAATRIKRAYVDWENPEQVEIDRTSFDANYLEMEMIVPDGTIDLYTRKLLGNEDFWSECKIIEKSALEKDTAFRWRMCGNQLIIEGPVACNFVMSDYFNGNIEVDSVEEVVVSEGVEILPYGLLHDFLNLKRLQLPASLRKIGKDALWNWNRGNFDCTISQGNPFYSVQDGFLWDKRDSTIELFLKDRKIQQIPSYIRHIKPSAFMSCSYDFDSIYVSPSNPCFTVKENVLFSRGLDSLYLYLGEKDEYCVPESVKYIGDWAFFGRKNLKKVKFGGKEKHIGNSAFFHTNLKKVVLPSSVESIGAYAFSFIDDLRCLDMSKTKVKCLPPYALGKCRRLSKVLLPHTLESIQDDCFVYDENLKEVELPSSLKYLEYAFRYSGIKNVILPDKVVWLNGTFFGCGNLENVYINWRDSSCDWAHHIYMGNDGYRNCNMADDDAKFSLYVNDPYCWSDRGIARNIMVKRKVEKSARK